MNENLLRETNDYTQGKRNESLTQIARNRLRDVLRMIFEAGDGHPGSCLSVADIIAVLYYDVMRIDHRGRTGLEGWGVRSLK